MKEVLLHLVYILVISVAFSIGCIIYIVCATQNSFGNYQIKVEQPRAVPEIIKGLKDFQ